MKNNGCLIGTDAELFNIELKLSGRLLTYLEYRASEFKNSFLVRRSKKKLLKKTVK